MVFNASIICMYALLSAFIVFSLATFASRVTSSDPICDRSVKGSAQQQSTCCQTHYLKKVRIYNGGKTSTKDPCRYKYASTYMNINSKRLLRRAFYLALQYINHIPLIPLPGRPLAVPVSFYSLVRAEVCYDRVVQLEAERGMELEKGNNMNFDRQQRREVA